MEDGLPTLNSENAVKDENHEPRLYPAVYSSSSYGQKDLPKIFKYSLNNPQNFTKNITMMTIKYQI